MTTLVQRIRSQSKPLSCRPTELQPRLDSLPDIRVLLFDIYGTLMISASGDIGSNRADHCRDSLISVAELMGLKIMGDPGEAVSQFEVAVRAEHDRLKQRGVAYPEVDYREIWANVLPRISSDLASVDFEVFSVEFELRVNPTWPMPGAETTLASIRDRGLMLGIVSNAQFFTPLLFPAHLDESLEGLGFAQELMYFSYEHRRAKPGTDLYELAASKLAQHDISPTQVLYVGNDMLNDITAAAQVGFRTALFAGDQRSLRLRSNDDRVHGVEADIVVTELPQLIECLPQQNNPK